MYPKKCGKNFVRRTREENPLDKKFNQKKEKQISQKISVWGSIYAEGPANLSRLTENLNEDVFINEILEKQVKKK